MGCSSVWCFWVGCCQKRGKEEKCDFHMLTWKEITFSQRPRREDKRSPVPLLGSEYGQGWVLLWLLRNGIVGSIQSYGGGEAALMMAWDPPGWMRMPAACCAGIQPRSAVPRIGSTAPLCPVLVCGAELCPWPPPPRQPQGCRGSEGQLLPCVWALPPYAPSCPRRAAMSWRTRTFGKLGSETRSTAGSSCRQLAPCQR